MLTPGRMKLNPFNSPKMLRHDTAVYHVQCRKSKGAYHAYYTIISNKNRHDLISYAHLIYDPAKSSKDGVQYFDSFEALGERVLDDWSFYNKLCEEFRGKIISIVWKNLPLTFELFRKAMQDKPLCVQKAGPRFKDLNTLHKLSRIHYSDRVTRSIETETLQEKMQESCIKGCHIFFEIMEARNKLFHPEKTFLVQKMKIPSNTIAISVDGEVPTFYDKRMYGTGIRVQSLFNEEIFMDYCFYSKMPIEGVPEEGRQFHRDQVAFPSWATRYDDHGQVIQQTRKVIRLWMENYPSLVIVKCPYPVEDGLFKEDTLEKIQWFFRPDHCIDASTLQMITPNHPLDASKLHDPHYDASHALEIVLKYFSNNKDCFEITPPNTNYGK